MLPALQAPSVGHRVVYASAVFVSLANAAISTDTRRPSACPGLERVVPALDGGICRVKLEGGRLSSVQARAIAQGALRYGSGTLEITNRSNMQIRGVRGDAGPALANALIEAGLGPRVAGGDDVRNVLLSPAAGRDPAAHVDTRALGERLLTLLQEQPAFHALSAKFAIQLDGGESFAALDHPHDIWLSALADSGRFALGLAGTPRAVPIGTCNENDIPRLISQVLTLFLAHGQSRMRDVLASDARSSFISQLMSLEGLIAHHDGASADLRLTVEAPGIYPQVQPGLVMVMATSRLGRLTAAQLLELAVVADRYSAGWIHLTPWQGVSLPDVDAGAASDALDALHRTGMLVHLDDPLVRVIACSGSSGCAKGLADTKADAERLALYLPPEPSSPHIHLTGCKRSCACAHVSPFTLSAQADGRYQLYQRTASSDGFGRLRASGLDIESAAAWLRMHHREIHDD
jgi:precorrin-3B synthase